MANVFVTVRKWLSVNWWFWVVGLVVSLFFILKTALAKNEKGEFRHEGWEGIATPLVVHALLVIVVFGCWAREWIKEESAKDKFKWLEHWGFRSVIQILAVAAAVGLNDFVVKNQISAGFLLLLTFYALSSSMLLGLPTKLELSIMWIGSTAILAWSKTPWNPSARSEALKISAALICLLVSGNFLGAFKPSPPPPADDLEIGRNNDDDDQPPQTSNRPNPADDQPPQNSNRSNPADDQPPQIPNRPNQAENKRGGRREEKARRRNQSWSGFRSEY